MLTRSITALLPALLSCTSAIAADHSLHLKEQARYEQNIYGKSAAEIIAYSSEYKQFYLVNGASPSVDILELTGGTLQKTRSLSLSPQEQPTSVAVSKNLVAVAVYEVQANSRPGKVIIFTSNAERLAEIQVGDLPDMVTFTKNGKYILTANEGEPTKENDPEGSVTIIELNTEALHNSQVHSVDFQNLDTQALRAGGTRISPGKTAAQDFEPEYISISGQTAYVALQENNALAVIDIPSASLIKTMPLGYKDHSLPDNGLDTSDKDGEAFIAPHPVRGFYMPDTIASFSIADQTYIATANEGDARQEDVRISKAKLDPLLKKELKKANTGKRLKISSIDGDTDQDGDLDIAYSYGTRSFSIWTENGTLVFDSGDQFAQKTLQQLGFNGFNASNTKNGGDNRSDDKGSEPEAIAVGKINGQTYAFIGLERTGGIMMYDISDPPNSEFISYYNNRNFDPALDPATSEGSFQAIGHLGPECILFIPEQDSPYGKATLAVAYEVSGSVALYTIE